LSRTLAVGEDPGSMTATESAMAAVSVTRMWPDYLRPPSLSSSVCVRFGEVQGCSPRWQFRSSSNLRQDAPPHAPPSRHARHHPCSSPVESKSRVGSCVGERGKHRGANGFAGDLTAGELPPVNPLPCSLLSLASRPVDPAGLACQWLLRVLGLFQILDSLYNF
jgi:hypothetical protein